MTIQKDRLGSIDPYEHDKSYKFIDLSNQKFGHLTVIRYEKEGTFGHTLWRCKCDCGRRITVRSLDLRKGHIKSCQKCKL